MLKRCGQALCPLAVALAVGAWLNVSTVTAQVSRCDAARELLQTEVARLRPGATRADLENAKQNIRRAVDMCAGLGDAHYYLSLIARELKDEPGATFWLRGANTHRSAALLRNAPLYSDDATASVAPKITPPAPRPSVATPRLPPAVRVSATAKRKIALVVGVSRFKDPRINVLKYTARDAQAIGETLEQLADFDYVKILLDENATRYNLQTEIDRLAKMATRDDLVVFYVASHGSPENLDTAGVNYIVTYDTEVSNIYPTAYRMDDLTRDINDRIKAERVVAFLDTCYSGGTYRVLPEGWVASSRSLAADMGVSTRRLESTLRDSRALIVDDGSAKGDRVPQGIGRVIITSSTEAERSWEDDKIQHGYFTYYLLEALRREGPVSIDEIFDHLRVRVPAAVLREKKESQNPQIVRSRERVELYVKDRPLAKRP